MLGNLWIILYTMPEYQQLLTRLDDISYQTSILKDVSRTFALTIPQLPESLSVIVSNAYLLCRIADTIEDDKSMPADGKRNFTAMFIRVVAGQQGAEEFSRQLFPLLSAETPGMEHDLIVNTAAIVRITHGFNRRQRAALERCVTIMAQGMARYQNGKTLEGVSNIEDMNQYCYYVAGVVGEMLTELFCDYSDEIGRNQQKLMPLAVSFGQALQMTNILKDIWEDHHRGACWLPRDLFSKYGVDISRKQPGERNEGFRQALSELIGIAHAHSENALHYILMLPPGERGLRRFCLWALGMAVLTLDNIHENPWFTTGNQVKISRHSVKATMLFTNALINHDSALRSLFDFARRNLPVSVIRPKLILNPGA